MSSKPRTLPLVLANVLLPIAILIFASGFFPYKPFLPGLAVFEPLENDAPPGAPFDKLVFMVVDALRSDFVYLEGSGFEFTQSLIANGEAMPYTAHATSPTITMPRIKALTTGSTPSFLDMILSFAESDTSSSLSVQDTWLAQMKAKNTGKLVMYGDDTWLKLFPDTFDRADGTTSFFVSDFTEVDNNVTRHVPEELLKDDWNTMVLHYLGLDHIGHKAGPRSPNMVPKQREMDGIVRQVYEAMQTHDYLESALLVLCGDHGMNDAGNHGGSAPGETSPALVFISPKLKTISLPPTAKEGFREDFQHYSAMEQSDVAPTLAALLGFPVPKNNLGAFLDDFLPFWPDRGDQAQILLRNAMQILEVVKAASPSSFAQDATGHCANSKSSQIDRLACEWWPLLHAMNSGKESGHPDELLTELARWTRKAQEEMSSTASIYDVSKLVGGLAVAGLATALAFFAAMPVFRESFISSLPFLGIVIAYGIMMFASSYVEEEQNFWYWASSGWLALMTWKGTSRYFRHSAIVGLSAAGALLLLRLARRWNQTGQKYAGSPDIARGWLAENPLFLWDFVAAAYLWNCQALSKLGFARLPRPIAGFLSAALLVLAISFKVQFTNEDAPELIDGLAKTVVDLTAGFILNARARAVFFGIAAALMYTVNVSVLPAAKPSSERLDAFRTLHTLLTLFLTTQSRTTNIPLLLVFEIQSLLLSYADLSILEISTTSLLLQHASFFALGNSNAISSIDLSSAYNGVSEYNVFLVGLLTFVSNWAGPVYWMSATNLLLLKRYHANPPVSESEAKKPSATKPRSDGVNESTKKESQKRRATWSKHVALLTIFATSAMLAVMASCTVLRQHLFIWTVFSPKYLYAVAWTLGQHLLINIGLGSVLFLAGSR